MFWQLESIERIFEQRWNVLRDVGSCWMKFDSNLIPVSFKFDSRIIPEFILFRKFRYEVSTFEQLTSNTINTALENGWIVDQVSTPTIWTAVESIGSEGENLLLHH